MSIIRSVNAFLWSYPILILLIGTHIYFTFHLRFIQRKVFHGIRLSVTPERSKHFKTFEYRRGLGSFSALMTTLAATLGTGNIIGMSTAVALGGPGAVFWCWITGLLGMATSYAECLLCHRFRTQSADGTYTGGAMYIFSNILKHPLLGIFYAVGIVTASLLLGCACQSNSIALTGMSAFHLSPAVCGILCAIVITAVLIGGCRFIGKVCAVLVPFMGIFYIVCCVILLYLTKNSIQPALKLIFCSAFSTRSLTGGILGGGITATLRYGIARGLFTNEAGLGTAGIASACARTDDTKRQALISMTGVFWDTVVMCGITGLLIVANFLDEPSKILSCSAGELTLSAFSRLPHGEQLLAVSLILFALSTIIGWFFLGEQAFTFLTTKELHHNLYKCLYLAAVFAGALISLDAMWELTDFINLFLLLPNLYLLLRLRKYVT